MSPDALALVLLGAALHAAWNIVAKRSAGGGAAFVWMFGLVSVAAVAPWAVRAGWAHPASVTPAMGAAALASAAIHLLYSLILQRGYRASAFSVVYPVARGSGPMFSVAAAVVLWSERPGAAGWLGVAAVLTGLFLSAGGANLLGSGASDRQRAGMRWGLATGLCIAGYTLIDGWAVRSLGLSPVLYYALGLLLRTLLLTPVAWRRRADLRPQWHAHRRAIVVVGLLSPAAYLLVLLAMQLAPLSFVAPVREVSMLIGTFVGARLLGEAVRPAQVAGAGIMVAGVLALAWA